MGCMTSSALWQHQPSPYAGVAKKCNRSTGYAGVMNTEVAEVTGAVAVVRDFVNTSDHDEGTDELDSRAGLSRWLVATGFAEPGPEATAAELDLALRLRDGLRRGLEL